MRLRNSVIVKVADDTEMKDKLFDTDATLAEVIMDGYTKVTSGKVSIAATETESIDLGDITAIRGIFLKVDQECSIVLNGGDPIVARLPATGKPAKIYLDTTITSVAITSVAGAVTNVVWCAWGDVAP